MFDRDDWGDWISKVKWLLISFKFISFLIFIFILIGAWLSLECIFIRNVELVEDLFKKGMLEKAQVSDIIGKSFEILYDKALGHILLFVGGILASIIAIKGISNWVSEKTISSLTEKLEPVQIKEKLDKIIKRKN